MDQSLRELYQEVILDHSRHPRHFGVLDHATHKAEGYNPLCGDRVTVTLVLGDDRRVTDIKFTGKGCAISQASASLMTEMLAGRTLEEAQKLMDGFVHLVKGEEAPGLMPDDREHLDVMSGLSEFPMRVKCATLAWHTFHNAVEEGSDFVNEEALKAEITASAIPPLELEEFTSKLVSALKTVYDPEIPVDVYELGLIYKVDVADNKDVAVDMTLTAPNCPVAGEMPGMVKDALAKVEGIGAVSVTMTFDPPWTPDRMSEEAKLELNMF